MAYLSDLRTVKITDSSGVEKEVVGGSFRGVPFYVASHQFGTGRRIAVHEYPGIDDPDNEDMGRSARSVSLEAYLLGDDVKAQKEKLLAAVETKGTGKLVHPYLGTKNAKCSACQISESSTEKMRVGLSLTFVLDPDIKATPVQTVDRKASALLQATSAKSLVASKFAAIFYLTGAAKNLVDAAVTATNKMLDQVESARDSMRQAAAYISKLGEIRQNLDLLISSPLAFAALIKDLLTTTDGASLSSGVSAVRRTTEVSGGATTTVPADDQDAKLLRVLLSEAMTLATVGSDLAAVPSTGAKERKIQASNQEALVALFQQTAAFDMATQLVGAQVTSVEDAGALQTQMNIIFEDLLGSTTDPEIYQATQDVQAAALAYLRETSADLAVILTTTPRRTVPALVLAYEIYGTYSRFSDIVDRNSIPHPGFIPGGHSLEILSK